jgi:ubiquinone/menaquinone biosynthesis C-methylase UbiE
MINHQKVLKKIRIKKDIVVADFGCGPGSWSVALAPFAKRVYAIDIKDSALSVLTSHRIENIIAIKENLEKNISLEDNSIDLVIISNLLFQVNKPKRIMKEAERVLKPKGKALVIEWKPTAVFGPKGPRLSSKDILELNTNLVEKKCFSAGEFHYALLVGKK